MKVENTTVSKNSRKNVCWLLTIFQNEAEIGNNAFLDLSVFCPHNRTVIMLISLSFSILKAMNEARLGVSVSFIS